MHSSAAVLNFQKFIWQQFRPFLEYLNEIWLESVGHFSFYYTSEIHNGVSRHPDPGKYFHCHETVKCAFYAYMLMLKISW